MLTRKQFFNSQTYAYVGGYLLLLATTLVWHFGDPRRAAAEHVFVLAMLFGFGLFHAALFAMGCSAAGIERIPRASWPLIAAMLVTASLQIALDVSSTPLHPLRPAALADSRIFEGAISLYLFVAPALAGMLTAWLWRRFNPRNPAGPDTGPTASA